MKMLNRKPTINRRDALTGAAAGLLGCIAAPSAAQQGEAGSTEALQPEGWKELVSKVQQSATPHAGAADRWTIVRKDALDALFAASDGVEPEEELSTGTPILRLFREHQAILDAAHKHVPAAPMEGEDEEMERLFYKRMDELEAELMALPCTCAADFAAKAIVDSSRGDFIGDWVTGALWIEARQLTEFGPADRPHS